MTEAPSFFQTMLAAVLDCPEELGMDKMRARLTLDSAGSQAVEAAIAAGDTYAAALYRLALGETRESLRQRIEAGAQAGTASRE